MPYKDKERQKEYQRQHYLKNKASYRKRARAQRINMVKIQQSLKDKPCADCGIKYPYYVMDFDHVRGDKKTAVSAIFPLSSARKLVLAYLCGLEPLMT